MSDNEDATAALGHSEELSVKHSVSEPVPDFCQRPEEGSKIFSSVRRQDTGDVFENDPTRFKPVSKPNKINGESAARICRAHPSSGDGEGLARCSADEQVDGSGVGSDLSKISIFFHLRKSLPQDGVAEIIYF
jgi:hypothetical protein